MLQIDSIFWICRQRGRVAERAQKGRRPEMRRWGHVPLQQASKMEPEVNTPQNPDRTTNLTIMDHDEERSTIELQINRI